MRFDPQLYTHIAAQAAVTTALVSIPAEIAHKAATAPGVVEGNAIQVHDGIGVFKWVGEVGEHVDAIPADQITMGMVLLNQGGFGLRTAESPDVLPLPVGAVWRLNSHVPHAGVQTEPAAEPLFIGILWDAAIDSEPTPQWFVSEALGELWAWAEGANPSKYERIAA